MKELTDKELSSKYGDKHSFIEKLADSSSAWIAKILVRNTNISANQVSLLRLSFFIIPGGILFTFGEYKYNILALIIILLGTFLDFVDGKIARLRDSKSRLGNLLEHFSDAFSMQYLMFTLAVGTINDMNTMIIIGSLFMISLSVKLADFAQETYYIYKIQKVDDSWFFEINKENNYSVLDIVTLNLLFPRQGYYSLFFTLRFYLLIGILFNLTYYIFLSLMVVFFIRNIAMVYSIVLYRVYEDNNIKKCKIVQKLNTLKEYSK